jgi:hypothetical protein
MKKSLLTILGLIFCLGLFAQQIPQKISYQGKLYKNDLPVDGTKSITFTIGTWSETHSVQITNGLYSVQLGDETPIPINLFTNNSNLSLQISVEGSNLSPLTEILSVPYAFKARVAIEAENVFSGNYNDLTNKPTKISNFSNDAGYITDGNNGWNNSYGFITDGNTGWNNSYGFITSPNDADANSTNEIQTLSKSGSNITLSNSGGSVSINDADASATNEIQSLSLNSNDLSISNGNTVALPSGLTLPYSATNAGDDIFEITSTGEDLAKFEINNPSSTGAVLTLKSNSTYNVTEIRNSGSGDALYISNGASGGKGIRLLNNGGDDALYISSGGGGYAGYFSGNVKITGTLSKGSGSFIIDHPTDPENMYMYHSFVESPDMMNIYNGNVVLDKNGNAQVELPNWFEALNMEFRYQLTCIGGFAQVYISERIKNNTFEIAGGTAGLEVSWQVTGVRNDPYAIENRIQVEVEKSEEEKGHYLHYKEYNQPVEKSIEALNESKVTEK